MKITLYLFFSCTLLLVSCQWDGYEPDTVEPDTVESNEPPKLSYNQVRNLGRATEMGESAKQNLAWWGYEENVDWVEGAEYRDNGMLRIDVVKTKTGIMFMFKIDGSLLGEFPEVYNRDFSKYETADHLEMKVTIKNDKSGHKIKFKEEEHITSNGKISFAFELYPSDLESIEAGGVSFTIDIDTELITFFDKSSNIHPIKAVVQKQYVVPPIYKTDIYFKKLTLNEEKTDEKLGDNDWNNPAPETGIQVSYAGQSILYDYTQNHYELNRKLKGSVYHLSEDDTVVIDVLDVDYGFNFSDLISDTIIRLKTLEGKDYFNLKLDCVEELLIYSQFKGRIN